MCIDFLVIGSIGFQYLLRPLLGRRTTCYIPQLIHGNFIKRVSPKLHLASNHTQVCKSYILSQYLFIFFFIYRYTIYIHINRQIKINNVHANIICIKNKKIVYHESNRQAISNCFGTGIFENKLYRHIKMG